MTRTKLVAGKSAKAASGKSRRHRAPRNMTPGVLVTPTERAALKRYLIKCLRAGAEPAMEDCAAVLRVIGVGTAEPGKRGPKGAAANPEEAERSTVRHIAWVLEVYYRRESRNANSDNAGIIDTSLKFSASKPAVYRAWARFKHEAPLWATVFHESYPPLDLPKDQIGAITRRLQCLQSPFVFKTGTPGRALQEQCDALYALRDLAGTVGYGLKQRF